MRKAEMEVVFGDRESVEGGGWFVAADYECHQDSIRPLHNPDQPPFTWTRQPLSDPQLFLSFARLSARGTASRNSILEWVRAHGLLRRKDASKSTPISSDGVLNQEEEDIFYLREESNNAYRLLRLFELWRTPDVGTLRERLSLKPVHPPNEPEKGQFAEVLLDDKITLHVVRVAGSEKKAYDPLGDSELVLNICRVAVQADVQPYIGTVRPVFTADGTLGLHCNDLLTAMYWQFACLVSGKKASAICEICTHAFEQKRSHQSVCGPACRTRRWRENREKNASSDG